MKRYRSSRKQETVFLRGGILLTLILLVVSSIQAQESSNSRKQHKGPFVYVTNQGRFGEGNTVSVIDSSTNTVTDTIPVGAGPDSIAITPNGEFAYVANTSGFDISVIDLRTNTVVATIPLLTKQARTIDIDPDGKYAYATHTTAPELNNISVIEIATNTVVATIEPVLFASQLAISPKGKFAYVTSLWSEVPPNCCGFVSVIGLLTNTVVATIPLPGSPFGIAVVRTRNRDRAYVTNINLNTVSVIDMATNTVADDVLVGDRPIEVTITPDGAFAYVSNSALFGGSPSVSIISTATNQVVATVPTGLDPQCIAFLPNGRFAYVANQLSDTVSVIDTATKTVVATIPVAAGPVGVAVAPPLSR